MYCVVEWLYVCVCPCVGACVHACVCVRVCACVCICLCAVDNLCVCVCVSVSVLVCGFAFLDLTQNIPGDNIFRASWGDNILSQNAVFGFWFWIRNTKPLPLYPTLHLDGFKRIQKKTLTAWNQTRSQTLIKTLCFHPWYRKTIFILGQRSGIKGCHSTVSKYPPQCALLQELSQTGQ